MAIPSISTSDFVGSLRISSDNFGDLQNYIDEFYPQYLEYILGVGAVLDATNNDLQKWDDVLNGVTYYNDLCVATQRLTGAVQMCRQFIFFEYIKNDYEASSTGLVVNMNENSNSINPLTVQYVARDKYNKSISQINSELSLFIDNYTDYTVTINGISDIGGGVLSIETNSTLYLYDGDSVTINGTDYVVSNVIENVSFEITSALITADDYVHSPFSLVDFTKRDSIVL